jgi:hypothetical protein
MKEQRERALEDHKRKRSVISVATENLQVEPTKFLGYDNLEAEAVVEAVSPSAESTFDVVLDKTPFYAEMGGQVGDTGTIAAGANLWPVVDTKKVHLTWLHIIDGDEPPAVGTHVTAEVDLARRNAIQRKFDNPIQYLLFGAWLWTMRSPVRYAIAGKLGNFALRRGIAQSLLKPWTAKREFPTPPRESFKDYWRQHGSRA